MSKRGTWAAAFALTLGTVGCGGGGGQPAPAKVQGQVPANAGKAEGSAPARAVAHIEAKSGSALTGHAEFTARDGAVTLTLEVEGAPPGELAVHLHEKGDCSAADGSSAGPHWNPAHADHGRWGTMPFHLGDVGNLEVGPDGYGSLTLTTDLWSIGTGEADDIVGRSIVVHEKRDDFVTQPTGGAGGRIGCGVIQ